MFENTFSHQAVHKTLWAVLLPLCFLWSVVSAFQQPSTTILKEHLSPEFPVQWQGRPLRPLALTALETRFARQFPGTLARLTDGRQVLVWRSVEQPTRMLHPAVDCYQGLGYRIAAQQLERDKEGLLWRCFEATDSAGARLRVCERIVDSGGQGFTDTSAWYWAAALGQSKGPWQALTVATPL